MMSRFLMITGSALSISLLSGCATFGSNIKGDFSCKAPNGVCAPTGVIDDQALALIQGNSDEGSSGNLDASPTLFPGRGETVARSSDQTLRIVFPAHVGRDGLYHETTAVHAVVKRGAWVKGQKKTSEKTASTSILSGKNLADIAERAPAFISAAKPRETVEDLENPYVEVDPVALIKDKVEATFSKNPVEPVPETLPTKKIVGAGTFGGLEEGGR